jgi:hypothetical protein
MSANNNAEKPKAEPVTGLDLLRQPFPAHQISKLPKETKKQREERETDRSKGINCQVCGGWHHRNAVHLDYVGHAALTDRLLDTDPLWSWEPAAFRDGLPAFDNTGGLWIKLTVCGVTRLGYGHAAAKPQMDPGAREKEVIGDALRNAAMRFGAALDLWHKGDLHLTEDAADDQKDDATSGAVLAAGVAIDLCKTELALTKWSASNAEMIAKLDAKDKTEVRRLYGVRLEKLRNASREDVVADNASDPFSEAA